MKTAIFVLVVAALLGKGIRHIMADPDRLSDNILCSDRESERYLDKSFDDKCKRFDNKTLYVKDR
jgi:hypothetical protein